MTESTATRVATVLMAAGGTAIVYYVVRTPPLRRLAVQLGRRAVLTWGPAWLATELRSAWAASGRHPA
jgi:hypothetical protein